MKVDQQEQRESSMECGVFQPAGVGDGGFQPTGLLDGVFQPTMVSDIVFEQTCVSSAHFFSLYMHFKKGN